MLRLMTLGCVVVVALLSACKDDGVTGALDAEVFIDLGQETVPPGPPPCSVNEDCRATNPCRLAFCDEGFCAEQPVPDGVDCSGDPCKIATCTAGVCSQPVVPPPACGDRICGKDACGHPCGQCAETETCTAGGQCQALPCDGITFDGCCTADGVSKWCDEGQVETKDCKENAGTFHYCGWSSLGYYCSDAPSVDSDLPRLCPGETCTDTCEGKPCGWVCGQKCGSCQVGQYCSADLTCVPCAPDQCGGECGTCPEGKACLGGVCLGDLCAAGDDGTGCCTSSGTAWCGEDGTTQYAACPDGCGWDASNSWYYCGSTGVDPSGNYPRECVFAESSDNPEQPGDAGPVEAVEAVEPSISTDVSGDGGS